MSSQQHYLQYNPTLHSDRYISFVEAPAPGKKFQFSFYFFIFNILWLLQKKLFGLIPLWILMSLSSLKLYYLMLDGNNPMEHELLLLIIITPHLVFSCFIYKIQNLYLENIIWKHRNNIDYLMIRLRPYNLLAFSIFITLCIGICLNYFIMLTTAHIGEQNKVKAFFELAERDSPENRAKIKQALEMMEEYKQQQERISK